MRFGHFFYPMNLDPARDYQSIDACLNEAEFVERLGFDAIWIAEHHFVGEAVYGDALLFGAAVAVKTSRVLIGFCSLRVTVSRTSTRWRGTRGPTSAGLG